MSDTPTISDLTSDVLGEFRRLVVRDDWDGEKGLSRYNQANKCRFFQDDDLRFLDQKTRSDKAEELVAAWQDKKEERLEEEDTETIAEAEADKLVQEMRLRLLRAGCLRVMRVDPAYRASLIVGDRASLADKLLEEWSRQIDEDEEWVMTRSGSYMSVSVERK